MTSLGARRVISERLRQMHHSDWMWILGDEKRPNKSERILDSAAWAILAGRGFPKRPFVGRFQGYQASFIDGGLGLWGESRENRLGRSGLGRFVSVGFGG